jgi:hypothetical protein
LQAENIGKNYLNCRIKTIKKPAKITHKKTRIIANNFIRGELLINLLSVVGSIVSVVIIGIDVFVGEGVPVLIGNIKVMAGNGIKVVVAEGVGVTDGV